MAKIVYAVTALALGALVAGFFIDSTVPLWASIVLSGLVVLLILVGWSRRIRKGMDFEDADEDEIQMAEIVPDADDDHDAFKPAVTELGGEELAEAEPEQTIVAAPAPAKPAGARKKAASKATSKSKAKPKPKLKPKPTAATAKRKPAASKRPAPPAADRPGRVLVIPGRSRYHRPGCRFAKGDQIREVSETTAQRRGYEPCSVCGS